MKRRVGFRLLRADCDGSIRYFLVPRGLFGCLRWILSFSYHHRRGFSSIFEAKECIARFNDGLPRYVTADDERAESEHLLGAVKSASKRAVKRPVERVAVEANKQEEAVAEPKDDDVCDERIRKTRMRMKWISKRAHKIMADHGLSRRESYKSACMEWKQNKDAKEGGIFEVVKKSYGKVNKNFKRIPGFKLNKVNGKASSDAGADSDIEVKEEVWCVLCHQKAAVPESDMCAECIEATKGYVR